MCSKCRHFIRNIYIHKDNFYFDLAALCGLIVVTRCFALLALNIRARRNK